MTVSELIAALKALPGDMTVSAIGDSMDLADVIGVKRGSWASDIALEKYSDGEDVEFPEEDKIVLDDENGRIAVLITW